MTDEGRTRNETRVSVVVYRVVYICLLGLTVSFITIMVCRGNLHHLVECR